jgi:methionyl-tRNA formyltransferase
VRTVFLGSPPFATPVFTRLADSAHAILALVTPPDRPRGRGRAVRESPLVAAARAPGIEVIQAVDPHGADVLARLSALAPDVMVVASYGVLLKDALLRLAPHGCLNVHASLLPRHRGASPVQAAILAGDDESGVSVQRLVRELDAGDVLLERRRPIGPRETGGELLQALAVLGGEALVEALDLLAAGRATWTPQDHTAATRCRKLTKELGRIDWRRPAAELERFVRALTPWPGARALDPEGREITVSRAELIPGAARQAGEIVEGGPRFVVSAADGLLALERVTPAGRREMSGSEFLRGARLAAGQRMPPWPDAGVARG